MELKDFITGVLSETLNIDADGVASYFNEDGTVKDDAKDSVVNAYSEHLKSLRTNSTKTAFDDGFKKAQSEILTKFENDFKAKTGFKSDKKGIELVLDYTNSQKPVEANVTDDLIKKHPLYISQQEAFEKQLEEAIKQGEGKLNEFQTELSKKEAFKLVSNKGLELFHSLKPVLSTDPIKAKKQEEIFLDKLKGFDWEVQNNGDRIVPLKDGKVLENSQGHAITFDKLAQDITKTYFDLHIGTPKSSAGNDNKPDPNKKTFSFEAPKTSDDYANFIGDSSKSVEERTAYKEQFKGKF